MFKRTSSTVVITVSTRLIYSVVEFQAHMKHIASLNRRGVVETVSCSVIIQISFVVHDRSILEIRDVPYESTR